MTQHSLINDHICVEGNVWILWDSLTRLPMYRGYHCVASPNWNSWGAAKTQGHRILNLGCQRNTLSLCHPTLNSAPSPRFFLALRFWFIWFSSVSSAYLLLFFSLSRPFLSSWTRSPGAPPRHPPTTLVSSSSALFVAPPSIQSPAFFGGSLANPKPILRKAVSHSLALWEISKVTDTRHPAN